MISKPSFDDLLKKYMRSQIDSTEFYNEVIRDISMSDERFSELHQEHHLLIGEHKRLRTRHINLQKKNSVDELRQLRHTNKVLKQKIKESKMNVEEVKELNDGDVVTYVSSVSVDKLTKESLRQELEVTGGPHQIGDILYINVRSKGSDSEGIPTPIKYLEKIEHENKLETEPSSEKESVDGSGSV